MPVSIHNNDQVNHLFVCKFVDGQESGSDEDVKEDEDDAEAALKKEVAQMRESTEKGQRRFQAMESGANNVVFIRTQGLGEDES